MAALRRFAWFVVCGLMVALWLEVRPAAAEEIQFGQSGSPITITTNPYTFNVSTTSPTGAPYTVSGTLLEVIDAHVAGLLFTNLTITDTGSGPVGDIIYFASDPFAPAPPGNAGGAGIEGEYANSSGTIGFAQVQIMASFDAGLTPNPFFLITAPAAANTASPVPFFPVPMFGPLPAGVFEISGGIEFGLGGPGDSIQDTGALAIDVFTTPEPSGALLLGSGLLLLGWLGGRRGRGMMAL